MTIVRRPLIGLADAQEAEITVPTALLYSAEDTSFDRDAALATAARLHTSLVAGLPGARHLALLGDPAAFAGALGALLAALPAR